jgi:hypothetical protein
MSTDTLNHEDASSRVYQTATRLLAYELKDHWQTRCKTLKTPSLPKLIYGIHQLCCVSCATYKK